MEVGVWRVELELESGGGGNNCSEGCAISGLHRDVDEN